MIPQFQGFIERPPQQQQQPLQQQQAININKSNLTQNILINKNSIVGDKNQKNSQPQTFVNQSILQNNHIKGISDDNLAEYERLKSLNQPIRLIHPEIIPREKIININENNNNNNNTLNKKKLQLPQKIQNYPKQIRETIKYRPQQPPQQQKPYQQQKQQNQEVIKGKRFKSFNPTKEKEKGVEFNKLYQNKSLLKYKLNKLNNLNNLDNQNRLANENLNNSLKKQSKKAFPVYKPEIILREKIPIPKEKNITLKKTKALIKSKKRDNKYDVYNNLFKEKDDSLSLSEKYDKLKQAYQNKHLILISIFNGYHKLYDELEKIKKK